VGVWGAGPFENDGAADWSGEFDDAEPPQRVGLIRDALEAAANESDYLEVDYAQAAVAASAVVASRRPGGTDMVSVHAPETLSEGGSLQLTEDLAPLALRALDRVVGEDSEWYQLKEESGGLDESLAVLAQIRRALAS